MTLIALALILVAAMMHATWNYLSKRVDSGLPFVWLVAAVSSALYAVPTVVYSYSIVASFPPLLHCLLAILVSGVLHIAYFSFLQKGYREGDLSVVYPLARGSSPVWTSLGAFLLLGERPSPLGMVGTALVVVGVLIIAGRSEKAAAAVDQERLRRGRGFGLITGLLIAAYTLWDGHAVTRMAIPPLLLDFGSSVFRALVLGCFLGPQQRVEVARLWQEKRAPVIWVALLCSLAYILVLTAMRLSPISHIAPAREVSIVFGVLLGSRLLGETNQPRRIVGAILIVLGVITLTLG